MTDGRGRCVSDTDYNNIYSRCLDPPIKGVSHGPWINYMWKSGKVKFTSIIRLKVPDNIDMLRCS